jgi:hypothetical protein
MTGRSPLRRRRSALDCRAIEEEEEEEEVKLKRIRWTGHVVLMRRLKIQKNLCSENHKEKTTWET